MAEIPADNLEKGVRYRIDHRMNFLPGRVGVFDRLLGGTPPNVVSARFTNVRGPAGFRSPSSAYRVDEWTFRKSGQTLATEKVALAIGLPLGANVDPNEHDHALPDELEREVKKFVGKSRRKSRRRVKTRKYKRSA